MRRTGVWVSVFRNSVIHKIFSEFLQQLRDFRTQWLWLCSKQWVSPFYRGFFFICFWIFGWLGGAYRNQQQTTGFTVLSSPQHLNLTQALDTLILWISLSLDAVVVGEEDEIEEDVERCFSCLEGVIEVEGWELDEELVDKPGTTIGTKFSVLQYVRIPF